MIFPESSSSCRGAAAAVVVVSRTKYSQYEQIPVLGLCMLRVFKEKSERT